MATQRVQKYWNLLEQADRTNPDHAAFAEAKEIHEAVNEAYYANEVKPSPQWDEFETMHLQDELWLALEERY